MTTTKATPIEKMLIQLRAEIHEYFLEISDQLHCLQKNKNIIPLTEKQWGMLLTAVAKEINEVSNRGESTEEWRAIWDWLLENKKAETGDED